MMLNRVNPRGMTYKLREVFGPKSQTHIETVGGHIIVDANIRELDQAWYNWKVKGYYVQDAFHFLNAEQREFLMTGLTPEDWKKMFGDADGVHGSQVQ